MGRRGSNLPAGYGKLGLDQPSLKLRRGLQILSVAMRKLGLDGVSPHLILAILPLAFRGYITIVQPARTLRVQVFIMAEKRS
jgi:hypothetical protein